MYVSPRFRDIFSPGPIAIRRGRPNAEQERPGQDSDARHDSRMSEAEVNLIWLQIAEAHWKAAKAFMPECLRVEARALPEGAARDS